MSGSADCALHGATVSIDLKNDAVDRCLVDTDVIIWYLRGRADTVALVNRAADDLTLGASVISRTEVLLGMEDKERRPTRALLDSLIPYSVTAAVADLAGELIRKWRRRGTVITIPDALIAATAIDQELALLTYNRKHFPMTGIKFYL